MFRMKSTQVGLALALMVSMASLALAQTSTTTTPAAAPKTHATHKAAMPKTDLNSASKEDLMKLPGITDATAEKIIAARPFKTKGQLLAKGIVTKAEYAKLAAHVMAKPEAKATVK
jgi:DNA uptake protein ComE-like DNA-binding protein